MMQMARRRKSESGEGAGGEFGGGAGIEKEDLDLIKTLRAKRKADLEAAEKEDEDNS